MFPDKTKPISKPQKNPQLFVQKNKCQVSLSLDICKCPLCSSIYTNTIRAPLIICDNLHKICLFCFNKINQKCKYFPIKQFAKCYKCSQAVFKLKLNNDILQIIKQNRKLHVQDIIDSLQENIDDYIRKNTIYKFQEGYMLTISNSNSYEYVYDQKGESKYRTTDKHEVKKDLFISQIKTVIGMYPLPLGIFTIIARFSRVKLHNKNAQIGICTLRVFNQLQITKSILSLNTSQSIEYNSQLSEVLDVSKAKTEYIKIKISVNMFKKQINWIIMDDNNSMISFQQQNLKFGANFLQSYNQNLYFFMRYQNNQSSNQLLQEMGLKTKKVQLAKTSK